MLVLTMQDRRLGSDGKGIDLQDPCKALSKFLLIGLLQLVLFTESFANI